MPRRVEPALDQWHGISDPRKRKQIQDRLAQRARRQRLAANPSTPNPPRKTPSSRILTRLCKDGAIAMPRTPTDYLVAIGTALFRHGLILSIPCGSTPIHVSTPPPPHVPVPLRADAVQQTIVHFSFIDRFPLPAMRRNMILHADRFSGEEFLYDLFMGPTFEIAPGGESWEGWVAVREWRGKWGWLLEEGQGVGEGKGKVEEVGLLEA